MHHYRIDRVEQEISSHEKILDEIKKDIKDIVLENNDLVKELQEIKEVLFGFIGRI